MTDAFKKIAVSSSGPHHNIEAEVVWIGSDLLVYIWGGDAPHIGAVAMAQSRPSLADPQVASSSASVFTYVGHKEEVLAKEAAEVLSAALETRVVVTAGIHWDNLEPEAIPVVLENSKELVRLLMERLQK